MYRLVFPTIISVLFGFCTQVSKKKSETAVYKNIHWKLLSFEDTLRSFQQNDWIWLDAEFVNEKDSVFWNSHHEGCNRFIIQLKDTVEHPFFYPFYKASVQDSILIIAPKKLVLKDIFNIDKCPPFLANDRQIKCYIKIRKKISPTDKMFLTTLEKDEWSMIYNFLNKNQIMHQVDENNIVWIEPLPIPDNKDRTNIKEATVAYTGYFLDGRLMDHTDSLGIRYNDSLQLIEGLNYVIKKLDVGQSAKIILPSQLAFGSRGSFNKTVPPFTPLLYEIKLMQIQ
ncbi:MAG: hypothetical protein KatS3mg027_0308 [Bacteroidia bacterium]|nr:MAG: hypothetical protein KatS3mg027_0308 [Bacteroidia bacterium]